MKNLYTDGMQCPFDSSQQKGRTIQSEFDPDGKGIHFTEENGVIRPVGMNGPVRQVTMRGIEKKGEVFIPEGADADIRTLSPKEVLYPGDKKSGAEGVDISLPDEEQIGIYSAKDRQEYNGIEEIGASMFEPEYQKHREKFLETLGSSPLQRVVQLGKMSARELLDHASSVLTEPCQLHQCEMRVPVADLTNGDEIGLINEGHLDPYVDLPGERDLSDRNPIHHLSLSSVDRLFMLLDPVIWEQLGVLDEYSGGKTSLSVDCKVLVASTNYLKELDERDFDEIMAESMNRSTKQLEIIKVLRRVVTDCNTAGIWRESPYIDEMLRYIVQQEKDPETMRSVAGLAGQAGSMDLIADLVKDKGINSFGSEVINEMVWGMMERPLTLQDEAYIFRLMRDDTFYSGTPIFYEVLRSLEQRSKSGELVFDKQSAEDPARSKYIVDPYWKVVLAEEVERYLHERKQEIREEANKIIGKLISGGVGEVLDSGKMFSWLYTPKDVSRLMPDAPKVGIEIELQLKPGGEERARLMLQHLSNKYQVDAELGYDYENN